jgi:DNA replication and repair protein RecF
MHLARLEATDFRNLSGTIEFSPGLNILYGANAQGKTGWLEAIYFLATTKSFRTAHPHEAIRHGCTHGCTEAILRGTVARESLQKDLQLLISEKSKQTFVNGKREAIIRYLGNLDAIAFTADEMEIIRGGPESRRRFMDRGIVATVPSYLGTIAEYNRVLKQKNRLLRDASESDEPLRFGPLLQPWNDQIIVLGTEIHAARIAYVARLNAHLNSQLFQHETITIRYKSSLEGKGDLNNYHTLLTERLMFHLRNEIAAGYSLVGPHRDDLEVLSDGHDIGKYASSGQQRSALLILDLAQMSVYHSMFEEYPIFLTDDIDAELDPQRIETLLEFLEGKSQTIVSTSKRSVAEKFQARSRTYLIAAGRAMPFSQADDKMEAASLLLTPSEISSDSISANAVASSAQSSSQQEPGLSEAADEELAEIDLENDDDRHQAPF